MAVTLAPLPHFGGDLTPVGEVVGVLRWRLRKRSVSFVASSPAAKRASLFGAVKAGDRDPQEIGRAGFRVARGDRWSEVAREKNRAAERSAERAGQPGIEMLRTNPDRKSVV